MGVLSLERVARLDPGAWRTASPFGPAAGGGPRKPPGRAERNPMIVTPANDESSTRHPGFRRRLMTTVMRASLSGRFALDDGALRLQSS